MHTDFTSRIFQNFFLVFFYFNFSLTLNFVNYVDPVQAFPPQSMQPPLDSGVTDDPLAAPLPHYIEKSNIDPHLTRNVTTLMGQTAYLHCIVNEVGKRTVSFLRLKDSQVLTVGKYTNTSDTRFSSKYNRVTNDWTLQIKYPHVADEGLYECQISSFPSKSIYFRLWVVAPEARIVEGPDMYVEVGSSINLTCVIMNSLDTPVFVFWYHNNHMINYDSSRGSSTVRKGGGNTAVSRLHIEDAQLSDSGNYSCTPSNADAVSTLVYVVKVPEARIKGPDMYVEVGSSINLTCVIMDSPEAPAYVFWYHDNRTINEDSSRSSITIQEGGGNTTLSRLHIEEAKPSDSGNYICSPSNADAVSTLVYVVKTEANSLLTPVVLFFLLFTPSVCLIIFILWCKYSKKKIKAEKIVWTKKIVLGRPAWMVQSDEVVPKPPSTK